MPGLYVAGWIKRGASGGIGMNRVCGQETARAVIDDFIAETLADPSTPRDDVAAIVADRGAHRIDLAGWKAIDAAEKAAGKAAHRPRTKFVSIPEFEAAAAAGAQ